jgi:hypothetical protein
MGDDDESKKNGHQTTGDPEANGLGSPEEDEVARDIEEDDLEPMPAAVAELAASCVRFVAAKYGVPLDFTPDTLSVVDQYIRDARADVTAKPQSLDLLQATIGAYVGEVLRRAHHGLWRCEGEYDGWRIYMTRVYLAFNPIGMAREALLLESADGWHAHLETETAEREVLERRLQLLGEVEDDEYYAPSTRFDIVEIAVDALSTQMRSQGLGDVRFTSDDYGK